MSDTQNIIFVITTILILLITWKFSIKAKRPHGIPRFVAFESILLIVLLNIHIWFENPLAWYQIVSWIFLVVSIPLAVQGAMLLRAVGKPRGDFENTTKLVEVGLYKYIRHPLYSSLFFLGAGAYFKNITMETSFLVVINSIALYITARIEEKEMITKFNDEYIRYMKKTKMFVPYIF
jgi:protein-S-isoprenylcysteine O-methyltransferase Ste14